MEEVQKRTGRYWGIGIVVVILLVIGLAYTTILGMGEEDLHRLGYG